MGKQLVLVISMELSARNHERTSIPHLSDYYIKRSRDELRCFFINMYEFSETLAFAGVQRYLHNYLTPFHFVLIKKYYIENMRLGDIVHQLLGYEYFPHKMIGSALDTIEHVVDDAATLTKWFTGLSLDQYFHAYPANYLPDDE